MSFGIAKNYLINCLQCINSKNLNLHYKWQLICFHGLINTTILLIFILKKEWLKKIYLVKLNLKIL